MAELGVAADPGVVIDYGRTLDAVVEAMRGGRHRDSPVGVMRIKLLHGLADMVRFQAKELAGHRARGGVVRLELLEDHVEDFIHGLILGTEWWELVGPLEFEVLGGGGEMLYHPWRVRVGVIVDNARDEGCGGGKDPSRGEAEVAEDLAAWVGGSPSPWRGDFFHYGLRN